MKKRFILLILSFLQITAGVSQTKNEIFEILNLIHADSIKRTVQELQEFGTRRADRPPDGNLNVAQYLVNRLKEYGIANARMDTFIYQKLNGDTFTGYNVLGTITGEVPDSTVIIGAHLDSRNGHNNDLLTPAPGADDNATGCAQTIELARIFFTKEIKPRYNIDFMAYDFEEFGLHGSFFDAKKRKDADENIVMMLNNDMVGYQPEDKEWLLTLHWYDNSLDITKKAVEFCKEFTDITPFKPEPEDNYDMYGRSDSYAYFTYGFKTTFNIEYTFSPYYHSDNDLWEYLNFDYQKQVAHLNLALLLYYSKSPFNLSIDDINYAQFIDVVPNPATNFVRVQHGNDIDVSEISIYDIMGRLHHSYPCYETRQTVINIQNLSKGVYLLKINTNKGTVTKKIIKL